MDKSIPIEERMRMMWTDIVAIVKCALPEMQAIDCPDEKLSPLQAYVLAQAFTQYGRHVFPAKDEPFRMPCVGVKAGDG